MKVYDIFERELVLGNIVIIKNISLISSITIVTSWVNILWTSKHAFRPYLLRMSQKFNIHNAIIYLPYIIGTHLAVIYSTYIYIYTVHR